MSRYSDEAKIRDNARRAKAMVEANERILTARSDIRKVHADIMQNEWNIYCKVLKWLGVEPSEQGFVRWCWEALGIRIGG